MSETICTHQDQIKAVERLSATCLACDRDGTKPVAIRLCLTCGHVGCCDSSVGRHARAHFTETGHPIIDSKGDTADTRPSWRWCYIDNTYIS